MKAKLLTVDGQCKTIKPKDGEKFSHKELADLMDCGYIETIKLHNGRTLVVDESGKLTGKPYNDLASSKTNYMVGVVGDAVLI